MDVIPSKGCFVLHLDKHINNVISICWIFNIIMKSVSKGNLYIYSDNHLKYDIYYNKQVYI